ncbi:DsbE family thiol:disulfide interchange protein [Thalassotalea aquiviva]|uniref:DsbE family thiol:disulfide interchange protein n=1 Tax=Thalassotalea aquiviva TaxID=3242415 RepID=UPI00352B52FE
MTRFIRFLPLLLFFSLGFLLYRGLFLNPQAMPSALIGKPVPEFTLSVVDDATKSVSKADLQGDIVLLNVWATWCPACKNEHPYLLDLARNPRVKLYGVNYKDSRQQANLWLKDFKDPYQFSIFDVDGSLGLDLGVFGAPETFVIDHTGTIRMRFAGPIDGNVWNRKFLPLIEQIEAERAALKG